LKFILDENVPLSIKRVILDLGFEAYSLHDFNMTLNLFEPPLITPFLATVVLDTKLEINSFFICGSYGFTL